MSGFDFFRTLTNDTDLTVNTLTCDNLTVNKQIQGFSNAAQVKEAKIPKNNPPLKKVPPESDPVVFQLEDLL